MEFVKWRNINRLSKEKMTITEKIDGTNACILIFPWSPDQSVAGAVDTVSVDGELWNIWTQSRTRFVTPEDDNFGFSMWVWQNREELIRILGIGYHYGEWWGSKIQRGYALTNGERRFSLFNAVRWHELISYQPGSTAVENLCTVPLLYTGKFDGAKIGQTTEALRSSGSYAVDHAFHAEGIIVELREAKTKYKILLENDDIHKWETNNEAVEV